MTTAFYSHPIYLEHLVVPGHPERPDRLRAIEEALAAPEFEGLDRRQASDADPQLLQLVHPGAYVDRIRAAIPREGIVRIDADTCVSANSWEAALTAVGAATAAVDDVFEGAADNVFVACRPPGHHAERSTAMGFCLFDNVAIAARYAQEKYGVDRVAIIDWDVHHGNGTQDIFWDDPTVLYCSTHQMPLFPGTGALEETGAGNIFNSPLSTGDGSNEFREAFRARVLAPVNGFKPDLILISAGFDAHWRDPLAGINLTEGDFDWATGKLLEIAGRHAGNRLVSVLEGGYDLVGLSTSAAAHILRLMKG